MATQKEFGLMEETELEWDVKEEKVSAVNSAWTNAALAYVAATLAI